MEPCFSTSLDQASRSNPSKSPPIKSPNPHTTAVLGFGSDHPALPICTSSRFVFPRKPLCALKEAVRCLVTLASEQVAWQRGEEAWETWEVDADDYITHHSRVRVPFDPTFFTAISDSPWLQKISNSFFMQLGARNSQSQSSVHPSDDIYSTRVQGWKKAAK